VSTSKAAKPATAVTVNGLPKSEQLPGRLDFDATLPSLRFQYLTRRFGLEPLRAELVVRLAYAEARS
jgi:hypothetical protein